MGTRKLYLPTREISPAGIISHGGMEQRRIRKVKQRDKAARWFITAGGMLIIVSVAGIFFLIAGVAVPLFFPPDITHRTALPAGESSGRVLAVGSDEYLETAYLLTAGGEFVFRSWLDGRVLDTVRLIPPGEALSPSGKAGPALLAAEPFGNLRYSLLWADGSVSIEQVLFTPRFDERGVRSIGHEVKRLAALRLEKDRPLPLRALARVDDERGLTRVALLPGNRLSVTRDLRQEDLFGNVKAERFETLLEDRLPGNVSALVLDGPGSVLYAGTDNGHLLWWRLEEPEAPQFMGSVRTPAAPRGISALAMVLGGTVLAVGDAGGGLSTWFPVPDAGQPSGRRLIMNHVLRGHGGAVRQILPSLQEHSLLSLSAAGALHYDHTTNERALLSLTPREPLSLAGVSTRFNALAGLDGKGALHLWEADIPHPEANWTSYFSKIWYGSYGEPAFVWQSSAGEDDFEPKLSLMPLIFGTLKGTLYGMLFAAPLAILGAMYTSHLMHVGLRRVVKPAIEIMGSVPTVVVGFLAALWLAPLVKTSLVTLLLIFGVLPLAVLLAVVFCERAERFLPRGGVPRGYEFVVLVPVIALAVYVCYLLGSGLESLLFGGDLPLWLFQNLEMRFDQRNSIVIAFALGFAVIPIVFTMADDALVNVPRNLTAASLALGASRWQTVWRVVLPSASPGIFAALMIGLGRAVGETMIVLMATGNTPIMDMSPFNGMRTLAANIAVEIPEAPFNSTLYRTLFLSAVLLFMITFLLNSAAELVRQWLRKKYGRY